jgi:hypothetical protein
MVFAISYNILDNARFTNCGEGFLAIPAGVRLDSGVSSLVNEEVTLLGKDLAASYSVAFEQVLAAVGRFLVKIQSGSPRKTLIASLHVADVSINIFMAGLVMFEVLLELEGLATV